MPVILGILQRRTPLFERTPCVHDVSEHEGDEQRHHRHHLQGKETRRGIEDGQRTLQVGRRGIEGRPVVTRAQQQTGNGHDRPDARSPDPVTDICAGERNDDAVQHARYAQHECDADGRHLHHVQEIFMLLHEHLARRGIHRIPAAEESPYHEHEEEDDERQGIVPQAAPAPCPQLLVAGPVDEEQQGERPCKEEHRRTEAEVAEIRDGLQPVP